MEPNQVVAVFYLAELFLLGVVLGAALMNLANSLYDLRQDKKEAEKEKKRRTKAALEAQAAGVCVITHRPLCEGCSGPIYECDKRKNKKCSKKLCGICQMTTDVRFAKDPTDPKCQAI